jgi:hypothetical protein
MKSGYAGISSTQKADGRLELPTPSLRVMTPAPKHTCKSALYAFAEQA